MNLRYTQHKKIKIKHDPSWNSIVLISAMQSLSANSTFKVSIHGLYIAIIIFTLPLKKLGGTKHHLDGRHHNHQHVKYLGWFKCSNTTHTPVYQPHAPAEANQPIYWFVEGEGLGMQQGTSIWVGSPKSTCTYSWESRVSKLCCCTAVAVVIILKWVCSPELCSARVELQSSASQSRVFKCAGSLPLDSLCCVLVVDFLILGTRIALQGIGALPW